MHRHYHPKTNASSSKSEATIKKKKMVLLDEEGESWEERHKERKRGEVKEEGDMAGRLGGRR